MQNVLQHYPHLQRLDQLSERGRTAFAASCCERLIPNYRAFSSMERWGNPQILEDALEWVWAASQSKELDSTYLTHLLHACEEVGPDGDDFESFFTSAAIDAAGAVYYALSSLYDPNPEHSINTGRVAIRTIEDYLFQANADVLAPKIADPVFHDWINEAPLLKTEMRLQKEAIYMLESQSAFPSMDTINTLRRASSESGIQPFRRGLVKL